MNTQLFITAAISLFCSGVIGALTAWVQGRVHIAELRRDLHAIDARLATLETKAEKRSDDINEIKIAIARIEHNTNCKT